MNSHYSSLFTFRFALAALVAALAGCGGAASTPSAAPASSAPAAPASKPAAASSAAPASASAAGSAPASGLIKIKAAYSQTSAVQGPMYLAADQGFFRKYGLDVEISQVAGTQQVPAMTAGELQFGTPGGNELVSADLGGASLVMIAVASNYPVFSMYGAKGVNDVKDLVGKSVAITTAGSSTDAAAKIYLQHFGLDKQVKTQPAATIEGILAVVEKGDVAAGVVSPPTTVLADKAGLKELVNGPKLGVPMTHSGVTVTRDYLKSKPDVVKGFLQGFLDGWKFSLDPANEAAVEQTIAKWTKTDIDTAKAAYQYTQPAWARDKVPSVNTEGLQNVINLVDNPKAKDAKSDQFIDNSLILGLAK
jgi:ABC-type nitrate/sulfonate/bicarbonate transport system substrate-binding protein